ncbi:hypothetical protein ANCDUO_10914 [Ancylostoma duodenale]|uniref:Ig-like domain-containing protein n=1 Tax=Ancylostoma duodenale TaxID=51022 RepID=A0A0C2GPJ6_9BILA|nr:hypothetical protein ANCDUO_10914 [Ancylostoma duodenale]
MQQLPFSDTNAIFDDRNYTAEQPVPEVGFLIMSNISKDDEGLYWCRHAETGLAGEVFSLKVAYVDPIPPERYIRVEPKNPLLGEQVALWCPLPRAVPHPSVTWLLIFINKRAFSCSVLIYLLCALVLMRPSPRATMVPSMWARSNPLLGPGFRKVIVPLPDFITGLSADAHPDPIRNYHDV